MTSSLPLSPTIVVIGSDPALQELCREALPWAGCATEFAADVADAMTTGLVPDVMLADLPKGPHTAATLMHLREFAEAIGSRVIALTHDRSVAAEASVGRNVQVLLRPCQPEALWDALATALAGVDAPLIADDCRPDP
jgi:hypothetical protein